MLIEGKNKYAIDDGFCVIGPKLHTGIAAHTHDFAEFVYVFHGSCVHCVDGREYPVQKGDLLVINYKSVHSIRTTGGVSYADVLIKPEFIDESLRGSENAFSLLELDGFQQFQGMIHPENCCVHFSGEEQKRMEMLILWAVRETENPAAGGELVLRSCINLFLTMVFRKMALPLQNRLGMNAALLSYLKANCTQRLTMAQTARKCGYSEGYFSRQFRQMTGMTYTEYLTDCRLEKACDWLAQTEENVDEIIHNSGFADRTKFFKHFYQKTGMTPNKYRKMSKSNTNNR